eukprot:8879113-Alexandrium_andersonii.AAC.1
MRRCPCARASPCSTCAGPSRTSGSLRRWTACACWAGRALAQPVERVAAASRTSRTRAPAT